MRKYLFSLFLFVTIGSSGQLGLQHLLTENLPDPVGLDSPQPRFSWQLTSTKKNVLQTAYEINVSSGKSRAWNSGKIFSTQSVQVVYAGNKLESGKKYTWQVRVWDNKGNVSAWSMPASFQMALLHADDWKADWIEPGYIEDSITRPSPYLRKQFSIKKKIATATAYITAHGLYEASLNGKKIGDAFLTPGWTSYNKRLQYQVYDVTGLLQKGENAIGVMLGSGWYRGNLAWRGCQDVYGKKLGLLLQLEITYTDGTKEIVGTNDSWKSSTGSISSSEIYHGETIDARKEKDGWAIARYNDKDWANVIKAVHPMDVLVATQNEPVKKQESFVPQKIFTTPNGEKVIDFGQNLVGWVIVKLKGKAGDTITIQHAEVLDKKGNFYTANLRAAKATATYILKGEEEERFEPHFTFYGFRYIKISGHAGDIKPENFTAVSVYSAMPVAGSFSCSNAMVNQLQHNIQWGQNGNFLDVPTDCPQRDERLGWTGDAQVFSRTAAFNRNVNNFFAKWMKDVAADQQPNGSVPYVVPNVLGPTQGGSAGWADAATIIPWNMFMAYGDILLLKDQYSSMKAWVNYMQAQSQQYLWNTGNHFGDWLFYRPDDDNDGRAAVTDKYLIAQCFYAHSTQLLINAAMVLGKEDDHKTYTALLEKIKDAFLKEYTTGNGRLVSGTQTAYVLALNFDMFPESLRAQAAERLAKNIISYGDHLTTGFLGTPYLCDVLTRFGYTQLAYKLLLQETYPSWLYPVRMGATTIWERWDGQKPDSSFQTVGMNSFNHYAYGAIGDWLYRTVAGIQETMPGYKQFIIQPHTGGNLTHAEAELKTYYGIISTKWRIADQSFFLDIEIPANTTATIYLPATKTDILESGKPLPAEIVAGNIEKEFRPLTVGSGIYHFSVKL